VTDTLPRLAAALSDRYRIERELGQGGMATVYLAEDLKHGRKVAIKLLHPELSAVIGGDRFLAEIKVTANLQHPHILGLIDSGEANGLLYYVMPYVAGESLRARLNREKQLPIDDAVRLAKEVASALDYAHRQGVVHRDIKPENILLQEGSALVADFGIALAVQQAGGSRMTQTGMSLGTPAYMSPEQAMGERDIGARSDVYALGAMTYEMLTGEPPFTGPNSQAIVAKVLTETPPPLRPKRPTVSPAVEHAVLTALQKLPADRFGTAKDFADALDGGGKGANYAATVVTSRPHALTPSRPGRALTALSIVTALSLLAAAWGWLRSRSAPSSLPPSRLAIIAPGVGGSGAPSLNRQIALTPDGSTVLFIAVGADGLNRLMSQPLYAAEAAPIPGLVNLLNPAVSPDGRWVIGAIQGKGVFRFSMGGGTGLQLPEFLPAAFAAWDNDGMLWFSGANGRGLARLGGGDSVVPAFAEQTARLQLEQILPDGHTALMQRRPGGSSSSTVLLFDLRSGKETPLIDLPVVEARYTSGYLVYAQADGTLQAVRFDPTRLRITSTSIPIATGVSVTGTGIAQMAVAPNGTLAYIPEEPRTLVFTDRSGSARLATPERHNFHHPNFSPDGRRLSTDFNSADGRDVWILALDQGTLTRATFDRDGHDATWTPDGRFITYTSLKSGTFGIYRTRPGNAEPAESLLATPSLTYTGLWLPDGSGLVATADNLRPDSRSDIAFVQQAGRGPLVALVASSFAESYPAVSPDGRWLAFVSDQSGQQQVYVRRIDGQGDQVQVSQSGGSEPVWGPDGRELFFRGVVEGQAELMSATVRTLPELEITARRSLFPVPDMVGTNPHTNYGISPDGKTFAMVKRSPATRIMVIQNLPTLVQRLQGAATTP
jgi:serine/threonine-protein kinase